MNNIKLDYRLSEIASNVDGHVICDIGCDHGKLSYHLLDNNIVDYVYISDISAPSLQKAIDLLNISNMQAKYQAIVSNGFEAYPNGVSIDNAVISGMGGNEIIKILSSSKTDVQKYVLQPQHNEYDVKVYLSQNGYDIKKDYIIKQKDKYYNIIVCVRGKRVYTESELYFGEENFRLNNDDFKSFLQSEKDKTLRIIDSVDENKKIKLNKYLELIDVSMTRLGE